MLAVDAPQPQAHAYDHQAPNAGPRVRLVNAFSQPFNNAIATARTCYAARVIDPEEVAASPAQRDAIAASTYIAGHHTTLQHAHFQFVLEDVSRQCLWSFFHAHPFYNSEQVSQRYVAVRPDRALVPPLPEPQRTAYQRTLAAQMACYGDLVALLNEPVAAAYFATFPARRKHAERYARAIRKKAQEVARAILPVATFAHLYHTVSGLTLHRYHRLCASLDVPQEVAAVVRGMIAAVDRHDPLFFAQIEDPIPLEQTQEMQILAQLGRLSVGGSSATAFVREFDAELAGRTARLVATTDGAEALIGRSVRAMLGLVNDQMTTAQALALVLDPSQVPSLGGALNLQTLGKLSRSLGHVHYTFQQKLSHAADSQEQRHRLTPGARPILHTHYCGGTPDLVVPALIQRVPAALDRFMATATATWQSIDALLDAGVSAEHALYLLPNAFPVRFYASGDLAAWHHKWTTRLCYNAQDEIWAATLDQVRAVRAVHPQIGKHLLPPCGLRQAAGLRPICPEGTRYCGVPVWKLDLEDYARLL